MERGGTQTNKSVVNYFHSYDLSCIYQFGTCKLPREGLVLVLHLREADSSSNSKSSLPCLSLFNNSERVAIKHNPLFYFGCCVYLCGFVWASNPRRHTAFLSSRRTFCYQSFEVALSWSGTPSIFSHLGYFCSHITSPVSPFPRSRP